jgi:hypothetical protein
VGDLSILPKAEPPERILDGVQHIFIGHTHDPFTGKNFDDPETGKTYRFYNTGASIFRFGFGRQINRHCFNALNVYLDSSDIEGKQAHITEVSSFKWPQHNWREQEDPASRSR